jgi:hypothetical protein
MKRFVTPLSLLALLYGCASAPSTDQAAAPPPAGRDGQAAAPSATVPASASVALITVPEPLRLSLTIAGHPDAQGGLTRQLLHSQQLAAGALDLAHALQTQSFQPGVLLDDALFGALMGGGRSVAHAADPHHVRAEFLTDYSQVKTAAARDLDVVPLAVGYWSRYPNGVYRPWVVVAYRLRDNRSGAIVASGQVGAGPAVDETPVVAVPQDDRFAFADFAALTADPARAAAGLKTTLQQVAAALAQRL